MLNYPVSKLTKPWNQPNQAVYSLSSRDINNHTNMNICTYVTAISMDPKLYLIAVFKGTKTHQNVKLSNEFILQTLSKDNLSIVKKLGKTSAIKSPNKLKNLKHLFSQLSDQDYLNNCVSIVKLKKLEFINTEGDHDLLIAQAQNYKNFLEPSQILYTYDLKIAKVIS